jgi:hypothetical protein
VAALPCPRQSQLGLVTAARERPGASSRDETASVCLDEAKTQIGYEIDFGRSFFKDLPPRPLTEIDADIRALETDIVRMLGEITGSGAEKRQ